MKKKTKVRIKIRRIIWLEIVHIYPYHRIHRHQHQYLIKIESLINLGMFNIPIFTHHKCLNLKKNLLLHYSIQYSLHYFHVEYLIHWRWLIMRMNKETHWWGFMRNGRRRGIRKLHKGSNFGIRSTMRWLKKKERRRNKRRNRKKKRKKKLKMERKNRNKKKNRRIKEMIKKIRMNRNLKKKLWLKDWMDFRRKMIIWIIILKMTLLNHWIRHLANILWKRKMIRKKNKKKIRRKQNKNHQIIRRKKMKQMKMKMMMK